MSLTIPNEYFDEILTLAGYPVLDIKDLELTKLQATQLFIWPAVRDYFKWFPLKSDSVQQVNGSFGC